MNPYVIVGTGGLYLPLGFTIDGNPVDFKGLIVGDKYRHKKGGVYRVAYFSRCSETQKLLVTYQSLDHPNDLPWTRPLDMFAEPGRFEIIPPKDMEKV